MAQVTRSRSGSQVLTTWGGMLHRRRRRSRRQPAPRPG